MPNIAHVQQYVSIVKDVVETVAAAVAARGAVLSFSAWRKQLIGNASYDIGRQLIKAALKLENAVILFRSPAIFSSEMRSNQPNDDKTAYLGPRWARVTEAWAELGTVSTEAEAIWGRDSRDVYMALSRKVNDLGINFDIYSGWSSGSHRDPQWLAVHNVVVASTSDVSDVFGRDFTQAVNDVTNYARKQMNKPQVPTGSPADSWRAKFAARWKRSRPPTPLKSTK